MMLKGLARASRALHGWFLLVGMLGASTALAYLLPGGAILRHLAQKREELRVSSLRAEGTVAFFGSTLASAQGALQLPLDKSEAQADVVLSLKAPSRCRLDVSTAEGGRVSALSIQDRLRVDVPSVPALGIALGELCRLFMPRAANDVELRAALNGFLQSLGVETSLVSLERQGDQVVYVLGKPAPTAPQFWVFKDSFLPARLKYFDAAHTAWEIRFSDYNSPSAGELFPRVVEVSAQGERLVRLTILKTDTRVSLPDRLFAGAP